MELLKKYGVLIITGVLLLGAVFANIRLNEQEEAGALPVQTPQAALEARPEAAGLAAQSNEGTDYFSQFRQERDAVRQTEIEYLDEVIAVAYNDGETLADAQAQKLALVENMEAEFTIENLLRAKGFADAAVTFHKGTVNVVVDCEALTADKVAQVLDIVQRETGESAENIKILAENG